MFNLSKHEAFETFYDYQVIDKIVYEIMYSDGCLKKNYSFQDFSEAIDPSANELFQEIYQNNNETYRGMRCANCMDEEAEDVKTIKSKIKGDLFEIFVMFTLQYFQTNSGVGIEEGSYKQIEDDFDKGVDFTGTHYATSKRVFGQIKYRNPHARETKHQIAFTCTEKNKLQGEADECWDFNKHEDLIMLVCNTTVDIAFHHSLKDVLGWTGTLCDEKHRYVKIIDKNSFDNMIGYENKRFWESFVNTSQL